MSPFDVAWSESVPGNLEDASLGDDAIRDTRYGLRERGGAQHKTYADETGHTDVWEHTPGECTVLFVGAKASFPTPVTTTPGCVAIATDENNKEYYWNGSAWTEKGVVLTGGQAQTIAGVKTLSEIPVFTKGIVANNAYLQARNAAGDGNVDLIKASATGLPVIPDGAALATSAAPDADAKIANKKYVIDQIAAAVVGAGFLKYSGATVFNTTLTAADTWQDLDLSSIIGARRALCFFELSRSAPGRYTMKPKGGAGATPSTYIEGSSVQWDDSGNRNACLVCMTDSSGILSHGHNNNTSTITLKLIGYVI